MTNILRDIGKDAKNGRIYLTSGRFKKFNYSEQEIMSLIYNDNFKDLMIYETASRAKNYFNSATANLRS
jgi:phytoene synthase